MVQERQAFRQHLSALMGGEVGTFASLVRQDRQALASRFDGVTDGDVVECVPTLFDLIQCYASFVKGKACGEGLLASDGLKLVFPFTLPNYFFPWLLKRLLAFNPLSSGRVV